MSHSPQHPPFDFASEPKPYPRIDNPIEIKEILAKNMWKSPIYKKMKYFQIYKLHVIDNK